MPLLIQDLYWVAGLIEGEGHFGLRRQGRDLFIQVAMTDCDVIDRLHSILGFGIMRKPSLLPSGKTVYCWSVTKQSQAAGLMMTLLPIMGERRAAKIRKCLEAWKAKRLRYSLHTHCKHGHPFSGDNLNVCLDGKYEKRRCRECQKLRTRKYRAKEAA